MLGGKIEASAPIPHCGGPTLFSNSSIASCLSHITSHHLLSCQETIIHRLYDMRSMSLHVRVR